MLAAAVALALAIDPSVQLAALAGRYRDYDLPLPPKDAKLYRLTWHRPDNPPGHQEWVEVGFALTINPLGKPEMVLKGLNEERWYAGDNYTEEELTASHWDGLPDRDHWFKWLVAIQCEAVGRHELAMTAWNAFTKSGRDQADANSFLAKKAWAWWVEQFHGSADRAKVARRLQLIATDCPDAADADLLRKLKLSLQPSDAKSGSVEALIDELLDVSVFPELLDEEFDPRLTAIHRLGFDAVPALIRHLNDDRLTRSRTAAMVINWDVRMSHPYSVKHFARDILLGYMCHPDRGEMKIRNRTLTVEDAEEWWKEAKAEGEETYLVRQLTRSCENLNLLAMVEHKYPKRLPEVFGDVAKEDPYLIDLHPLVGTLVRSSLPAAEKKKVLLTASESSEVEWKAAALNGLHQIDRDEFHKRLIAVLGDLPTWPDKKKKDDLFPAFYTCVVNVAMLTDDAKVWEAVGKYLETTSPEVKIEWVHHLTLWTETKDKCYRRAIGCLVALLSDESVRLEKNGDKLSVTSVRNDTAEELGRILGVKTTPSSQWTDDDWREFREEVAKAAKKVTEPKK